MYEPTDTVTTAAALLFRRKPQVDFDAFCDDLNRALDLRQDMRLSIGDTRGADFALLASGPFHVLVTVNRRRFPRRDMAAALASKITRAKVFDYEKAIAAHTCHITVHVGSGPEFEGEGIGEMRAASGQTQQVEPMPVGFRAAVLRLAIAQLATEYTSAVHWQHSNMILDASELGAVAGSDVPVLQAIHPLPLRDAATPDGQGIIAAHSEHFADRTIQIDPAPRPFAQSVGMALSMVVEKEAGRLPLEHGDTLETHAGETLHVRHEAPCKRWPAGRICLGLTPPTKPAPVVDPGNSATTDAPTSPQPAPDAGASHHMIPASIAADFKMPQMTAPERPAPRPTRQAISAPVSGADDVRDIARDAIAQSEARKPMDIATMARVAVIAACVIWMLFSFAQEGLQIQTANAVAALN